MRGRYEMRAGKLNKWLMMEFLFPRIKCYLHRWCRWWVKTAQNWHYEEMMGWFIQACRDSTAKHIAATFLQEYFTLINDAVPPLGVNVHTTA
jgi:hypothetical protein